MVLSILIFSFFSFFCTEVIKISQCSHSYKTHSAGLTAFCDALENILDTIRIVYSVLYNPEEY